VGSAGNWNFGKSYAWTHLDILKLKDLRCNIENGTCLMCSEEAD
jgi:hypothetical protein